MSSEIVVLANDELELALLPEYGARLHSLRFRGRELLRTPADLTAYEREPFFWGAFVMAPWCNRTTTDPLSIAGQEVHLPANFSDGTAIHGQVYLRPWQRTGERAFSVTHSGDGWPWRYRASLAVELAGRTVRLVQQVTNESDSAMPAGVGIHPWFAGQPWVAIHGELVYRSNTSAESEPVPVTGELDLRSTRAMAKGVDATWVELADPAAEVSWPDVTLVYRCLTATPHIVAANLADIDAIALESETHAPRGLSRRAAGEPGALTLLDPGSTLALTTVLELVPQG